MKYMLWKKIKKGKGIAKVSKNGVATFNRNASWEGGLREDLTEVREQGPCLPLRHLGGTHYGGQCGWSKRKQHRSGEMRPEKNRKKKGRRSKSCRAWVATVGILSFTEKDRKLPMSFEQLSGMIHLTFHRMLRGPCWEQDRVGQGNAENPKKH